jgi:deoxyadenosine/deoxycytidine kinase
MGRLIAIIGNCGTGKTTLAQKLCESGLYTPLLEQHKERPFQKQFSDELQKFSLANQFDYMLFRAEQELTARQTDIIGVQDGGLDQDFHVFTRLFHRKGFLDNNEFRLCERLYSTLRQLLPTPDLFIKLSAPKSILVERRATRKRSLDIVEDDDLETMELLIQGWLPKMGSRPVITLDTSEYDPSFESIIYNLDERIKNILMGS